MLVLSRKDDERIYIDTPGGRIVIVVAKVEFGRARIGIEAPRSFKILRAELDRKAG